MNTFIYWHPDIAFHDNEGIHPAMVAGRLPKILGAIQGLDGTVLVTPSEVSSKDVLRVHSSEHVKFLHDNAPTVKGHIYPIDRDTVMTRHTLRTITLSAGAVVNAVEAVLAGEALNAFCVTYAGHHAGPNRAEGFCFINNIAIGAMHAASKGERVAVVDFDTHSGNGTIWALRDRERIFFAETYQTGYPGKIISDYDKPENIRRILVTNREQWLRAWLEHLLPAVKAFNPEIILISAGFDAHEKDPLGQVGLKNEDYAWLTSELVRIQPKIVSALEGGYALDSTAECAKLHVTELTRA